VPHEAANEVANEEVATSASKPTNAVMPQDARPVVLNGLSVGNVRALLGQPATHVAAGPGETWTYHSGNCQVELYLFPDVSHGGLHVLDHQIIASDGEQACLRRLTDAHDN
jgi:hypothetical protein